MRLRALPGRAAAEGATFTYVHGGGNLYLVTLLCYTRNRLHNYLEAILHSLTSPSAAFWAEKCNRMLDLKPLPSCTQGKRDVRLSCELADAELVRRSLLSLGQRTGRVHHTAQFVTFLGSRLSFRSSSRHLQVTFSKRVQEFQGKSVPGGASLTLVLQHEVPRVLAPHS